MSEWIELPEGLRAPPTNPETMVEVRFYDGDISRGPASQFDWYVDSCEHPHDFDIEAYRLAQAALHPHPTTCYDPRVAAMLA